MGPQDWGKSSAVDSLCPFTQTKKTKNNLAFSVPQHHNKGLPWNLVPCGWNPHPSCIQGQTDTVVRGGLGAPLGISEQRRYSPSPLGLTFPFWAPSGICLEQVLHPGDLFVSTDLGSLSLTRKPSHTGGPRKRPTVTTSRQPEKPLSKDLTPQSHSKTTPSLPQLKDIRISTCGNPLWLHR